MKPVPLRNILSMQSIILALIPFAILVGLGAWWVLPQIRSEIEARQLQLATTIASQIENHLTAPTIAIKGIAALYGQGRVQASAAQQIINEQVRVSESLQSIYICGPQGKVAAVALSSMNEPQRQDLLGLDLSRNSLLLEASGQGRPVWSDTFLSIVGGGLSVAFAVPLDRMVIIGEIDLKLLTDFLKKISSIDEQKIFIVDRRGQVIADQEGRYTAQQLNFSNIPIVRDVIEATASSTGKFSFEGRTVMGSVISTTFLDWHVLVTLPISVAYRPLWTAITILAMTLLVTLVVGIGAAVFSARRLARRFERLAVHARRVATGDRAIQWPQAHILEFDDLAEDLQHMAGSIHQREEYNRLLFADSPIPLVVMDPETLEYRDCNGAAVRLYGYRQRDDLIGKRLLDFSAPLQMDGLDADAAIHQQLNTCLSAGHAEFEWHHQRSNGDVWYGEINLSQFYYEEQALVQFSLRDITQRRKAESALAESEANFRQVTETIREVFWLGSPDWQKIHYISPTYQSVWGLLREDLYKNPAAWMDAVVEEDRSLVLETFQVDLRLEEEIRFPEFRVRRPDGEICWISARAFPIFNDNGDVYRVAGIAEDITQRRQAEEDRSQLELQLRESQKLEAIGTLAGGIAHDFNNILSIIIGYAELSLYNLEKQSEEAQLIQEILKASDRAKQLVQQILAFSRHSDVEKKPIKISPIINEVVTFLKASIPSTIQIVSHIDTAGDVVLADATAIHQVLMNLCTNAWHSMKETGGTLTVSLNLAHPEQHPAGAPPFLIDRPGLIISVIDNGHGISNENLERIFEPYFSTKEKGQGTGLGLAVVHGIVKDHGGEISVTSQVGRGTVFYILLPLHHTDLVTETDAVTMDVPTGDETILLVDDETALVDISKQMLVRLGYQVTAVSDPRSAMEEFQAGECKFDLVITDKNMPHLTGFGVAKAIHAICDDIPIILCTGFDETDDSEKARQMGITEIVVKPVTMASLGIAVRKALDRRKAR